MKNTQYALRPKPLNLGILLHSYHLIKSSEWWFAAHACGSVEPLPGLLPLGPPRQDPPQLGESGPTATSEAEENGFPRWCHVQVGHSARFTPGEVGVVHKLCSIRVLNLELLVNEFGLCLCFLCEALLRFLSKG